MLQVLKEPRWATAKQSIYALIDRIHIKSSWRRTGGIEMATTNKSDGIMIRFAVKNGKEYVTPVLVEATQKDGEVIINVNGQNYYRQKINPDIY